MKKQMLSILTILNLSLGAMPAYAQSVVDSTTKVFVDNQPSEIKLKNIDGYTYISVRDVSDVLKYDIYWYDESKTAVVADSAHTLVFTVGNDGYYNNSTFVSSGNAPIIIDNKTYVALRDILTGTEVYFVFNGNDNTLKITSNTYDSNGNRIMTSEEYTEKYINNRPTYNYTPSQPKSTVPNYSYSYTEYDDFTEKINNSKNQALNNAAEAQQKADELQYQLNKTKCEEACRQAYIEYKQKSLSVSNKYDADALYQAYLDKVEYYESYYGVN
ncbi:MAG: copper amine oxidase N-terminal domain-containing protein [Candidatus Metalachnospira sp.]|nr:copper amine oxidase N-terminal domain-containing protein [Candidatus Metalachnospira sp.]